MTKLSGCPAVLSHRCRQEGTTDGRNCEARSLLLKASTSEKFFPHMQGKALQANGNICVGDFFNFGGSCFGFELSMGLSLPDQWYWRLPGA